MSKISYEMCRESIEKRVYAYENPNHYIRSVICSHHADFLWSLPNHLHIEIFTDKLDALEYVEYEDYTPICDRVGI